MTQLLKILACPACRGEEFRDNKIRLKCGRQYPVKTHPVMLVDEAER